jgi:redox-sensitive bicupin YhaK (pirin superfamily)
MGRVQFIAAVTLFAVGACSPSDASAPLPTEESVVGHYQLTLVNGGHLPFPIAGDTSRILAIIDGQMLINSDHTFDDILTTRLTYFSGTPIPSTRADTTSGTFVLVGSVIVRTHPGVGIDTVAVTGNLLHANNGGLLMTYGK